MCIRHGVGYFRNTIVFKILCLSKQVSTLSSFLKLDRFEQKRNAITYLHVPN